MKTICQLLVLSCLLSACSTTPSDPKIRQKLVGAWEPQAETHDGISYYPDGIWVEKSTPAHHSDYSFICDGKWEVKDGFIIKTTSRMTQLRYRDYDVGEEHFKVVHIDDVSLVLGLDGHTNLFVYKRL